MMYYPAYASTQFSQGEDKHLEAMRNLDQTHSYTLTLNNNITTREMLSEQQDALKD